MPLLAANHTLGIFMNPIIDNPIATSTLLRALPPASTSIQGCVPTDIIRAKDCLCLTQQATDLHAVQRALETTPPVDSARIEALRQALAEGRYQIDPQAIAQRMLTLDGQLA